MATSGLIVAAVALPAGLAARSLRPKGEPLLPPWKPWRVPWGGAEVVVAFIAMSVAVPVLVAEALARSGFFQAAYGPDFPLPKAEGIDPEWAKEAATLRALWTGVFSLPVALGLLWFAARALYPKWEPALAGRASAAGKVWLAVVAWLAVTPVVLVFHAAVTELFKHFGLVPDEHPLTKLGNRPALDRALFLSQACLVAPLLEELFSRGILLPWCVGRTKAVDSGERAWPLTAARPWFVMLASAALASMPMLEGKSSAPLVFAALLAAGLGVVWRAVRTGARRARAVYATAALFALLHSGVWPSPVPLFLLALALGWLAVRTNGILVPVIVHGLFNAVSAVFVLRGG